MVRPPKTCSHNLVGLLEEEDVSSVILKYFDNNDIIFRMREVSSAAKAAVENERCRDRHVPSTDAVSGL